MAAYSVVNNFANFKNLFYKDIQIWILPSPHTFMQSPKITFFKKHFSNSVNKTGIKGSI